MKPMKPRITVNELLTLFGPTQRIKIYDKDQAEVYCGYRAHLQHEELDEREREVKFINFKTEFRRRDENGDATEEKVDAKAISSYELKDIRIRNYVEIYTY